MSKIFATMEVADLDASNALDVPEEFFKNVKYFVVGDIPKWVEALLLAGGARRDAYMTERLTHVLADAEDDETTEARDLFSLPVVRSAWVVLSLRCGAHLPLGVFDPDPKRCVFAGAVVCPSKLSAADNQLVWALVTSHGGRHQTRLDGAVTHLVTTCVEGAKYECAQRHGVRVITPDWVTLSVEARQRLDEPRYHPSLLLPDPSAPPSPPPPPLSPPSSPVGAAKDTPVRAVSARQQQTTAALRIKEAFISDYEESELVTPPTLPPVATPAPLTTPVAPPVRIRIKKLPPPVPPTQPPAKVHTPPVSHAPPSTQAPPTLQFAPTTQIPSVAQIPASPSSPTLASRSLVSPHHTPLVSSIFSAQLPSSAVFAPSGLTALTRAPSILAPPVLAPPPPPASLMSQFQRIVAPAATAPLRALSNAPMPQLVKSGVGVEGKSSTKGSSKGLTPRSSAAKISQLVSNLPPPAASVHSATMSPPARLVSPAGSSPMRQGLAQHHGGAYGGLAAPAAGGGGRLPPGGVGGGSEPRVYYAHDPAEHVPEDVCLLGCVFYITDYQKTLEPAELESWRQVIAQRGGQVDDSYSNRITHVLCEHQRSDVFQLALRDGKRLVTAHWLSDCLLAGRMTVPSAAIHFPCVFGKDRPCADQLFCMTNFEGEDRERVKRMIACVGARYTGYMTRAHSALIARAPGGRKQERAVEWQVPVVNLHWLSSIVLGDLYVLKIPIHARYQARHSLMMFSVLVMSRDRD